MARKLIIGNAERGRIAAAMAHARTRIKPLALVAADAADVKDGVISFKERSRAARMLVDDAAPGKLGATRAQGVHLPDGYWCYISFEEQLPGLCKHLSISLMDNITHMPLQGLLPSPEAVGYIAPAFEISEAAIVAKWIEEYELHCLAINLVALDRSN